MKISLNILLAALAAVTAVAEPLPALHPVQVRRFADHLFDAHRYDDALHEYRRLRHMNAGNSVVEYNTALCHLHAGRPDGAAQLLRRLADGSVDARIGRLARNAYVYALYTEARYDSCLTVLGSRTFGNAALRPVFETVCLARLGRWDEAAAAARGVSELARDKAASACHAGSGISRKSPLLSSMLSLVPGLGNCYFGRYADGFYSFLVVAGSYASSHLAYQNDSELITYGTAGFGAVMHLGNIFGSATGARGTNRLRQRNAADAVETILFEPVVLGSAGIRLERF